jgi:hypothetical protein
MDADLVGAPCFQADPEFASVVEVLNDLKMRDGVLAGMIVGYDGSAAIAAAANAAR